MTEKSNNQDSANITVVDAVGNLEEKLVRLADTRLVQSILDRIIASLATMPEIKKREGDAYTIARDVTIYFFLGKALRRGFSVGGKDNVRGELFPDYAERYKNHHFSEKEHHSLYQTFADICIPGEFALRDVIHRMVKGYSLRKGK